MNIGSERNLHQQRRAVVVGTVSGKATYASKSAESTAEFMVGFGGWGLFGTASWPWSDAATREAARIMRQSILTHLVEAGKLTDNRSLQLAVVLRYHAHVGDCLSASHMPDVWDPNLCGGEVALTEAIEFYTFEGMGAAMKADAMAIDLYR